MSEAVKQTLAQFPVVLQPLFQPHRYKVLYGGRGAAKSWGIARALLIQGTQDPLRVLCCREVMRTIAESVHRLLADQIVALGLEDFYRVQETSITGLNDAEFLFAGLRTLDAAKIKSYEGMDVAWAEEAHTISQKSWDTLIPTIRADRSEIWASFNPELDSDDTYKRFVVSTPADAWVKKITYRDNPWFPQVLERERQEFLRQVQAGLRTQQDYDNIWEGNCLTVVAGAIYANEVIKMIEDRRVRPVPYDPQLPVHTVWDLGWNDQNSIILVQRLHSEVRLIEYLEGSFKTVAEWAAELQKKPYVWGKDYLPHDGGHTARQTGKTDAQVLRGLGRKVEVLPRLDPEVGIRSARMMFPRVYADDVKCVRLIDCLKRYRRSIPQTTGEPGSPVHDEFSHGADAFRALATIVDKITNDGSAPLPPIRPFRPLDPGLGY